MILRQCTRPCALALVIFSWWLVPWPAFAACKLAKMAELPVTMSDLKPILTAKINGEDARFIADSGAFFSMITEASAAEFNLKLAPAPWGLYVKGIGGNVDPSIATVKVFTLAGIPIKDVQFLVGGSTFGGSENVGVLGQNFFRIGDVEYDLAKGVIRLMHSEGCSHAVLAYWIKPSDPYSLMNIEAATPQSPHTTGTALINGAPIRVMLDTGAATSLLSLRAAARAGVKPDSAGVVEAGYDTGFGQGSVKTFIGPFSSFKIGDEEIRNTRLRFGDIDLPNADMLLGADFFLSHRIYVAGGLRKLFFTYNGGPVFNLTASTARKAPAEPAAESAAEAPSKLDKPADEPADAAAYSRRGTAFAARRDYEHAIADLTRACELDPSNAEYFYQRGVIYRENNQPVPAMADFNRALEINPEDVPALEARATQRIRAGDGADARTDLDAADRDAPKEADVRLFLGQAYEHLNLPAASIAQYDLWIPTHRNDARMGGALNARCWERALLGEDLAKALTDCNDALKLSAKASPLSMRVLDSRGLVRLRLGDYDRSIADYDDSLKLAPKNAWSLYGRGVAKMRKHKVPEGEADIAAASAIWPEIGEEFTRRGIIP
jgi:tetratricopeptide (TPR) repeat protein/predicted aspartyl protease